MKGFKGGTTSVESKSSFLSEGFLLQTEFARVLYHNYARSLPIIDYHCHLSPKDIAANRLFENLTQIWLQGDHYKWRAMRALGIDEQFITGDASDLEKFRKWAYTVPYTIRNPLYHWTHLELQRYFNVEGLLTPHTAIDIYNQCSALLQTSEYSVQALIKKMNVEVICTTDDPADDLEYHVSIQRSGFGAMVLPAFRPDKALAIEEPASYIEYLQKLGRAAGIRITGFDDLLSALATRVNYFHERGCRLSDHGLEQLHFDGDAEHFNPDTLFKQVLSGEKLDFEEANFFKYRVLLELGKLYHAKGWVQQFHLGALRNTNSRLLKKVGPDAGCDSIGDFSQAKNLAGFLNELDSSDQLSKTVIYNLNPSDNEVIATMIGNFNDGSVKGKIQFGSAWWFLDQKDGMEKQINTLSHLGLLSCFIGMLTDSRSFLSFPRHEYFRRILCNVIGSDVEKGELPADEKWLGKIVQDICYNNANSYFKFNRMNSGP